MTYEHQLTGQLVWQTQCKQETLSQTRWTDTQSCFLISTNMLWHAHAHITHMWVLTHTHTHTEYILALSIFFRIICFLTCLSL